MKSFGTYVLIICLMLLLSTCTAGQPGNATEQSSQGPTWKEQYDLGVRYLSEGNYQEAIIAFTAAIEIDPKQAPAYVGRGDAYVLSGETVENLTAAKVDYEKAIELDEALAEAYLGLADVYIRQGDYEKALEVLQQGLEQIGNDQLISGKIKEIETEFISNDMEPWGNVNYDGLYCNIYCDDDGLMLNDVLRFYADGTVISVVVGQTETNDGYFPRESWFTKDYRSRGNFVLTNQEIAFTIVGEYVDGEQWSIDYWGTVQGNKLVLDFYSYINGHEETSREYVFYPFEEVPGWCE